MNWKTGGGWRWGQEVYVVPCGQLLDVALWLYFLLVGFLFLVQYLYVGEEREVHIIC